MNPAVSFTLGDNPSGMSGDPVCGNAITRTEITDEPVLWYVVAAFPHRREPSLRWVSFGIEYDESRLEIIDSRFHGDEVETSSDWPSSGSGVRCAWNRDAVGNSIEVGWFVGYLRSEEPTAFRLVPGRDGGNFGDFIYYEPIDGYGVLGFGMDGGLTCPPLGICCLPNRDCEALTEYWCGRAGGVFYESTSCGVCGEVGACCNEWSCRLTVEEHCVGGGEFWRGESTTCDPNQCIPEGACCFSDGGCVFLDENQCISRYGAFVPGTTCDEAECPTFGACCYYEGDALCTMTTEEACGDNGSVYFGDGTVCTPDSCFPGLCCYGDGSCAYTTLEDCTSRRGNFFEGAWGPPSEACPSVCCCGPTLDSSWGKIKERFRQP